MCYGLVLQTVYLLILLSLFSFCRCNFYVLLTMSALSAISSKQRLFWKYITPVLGLWAPVLRLIYLLNLTGQKLYMTELK